MHPLMKDLSELSDEQLHEKLNAVYSRMHFARQTSNVPLYQQASLLYEAYTEETKIRYAKRYNGDNGNDHLDKIQIG